MAAKKLGELVVALGWLVPAAALGCPPELIGALDSPSPFQLSYAGTVPTTVREAQTLVDRIQALPVPTRENGARFVGEVDALARELHRKLEDALSDPAARAELEAYSARLIAQWRVSGYPPGLGPDIWNPVKDRVQTVADFYRHVPRQVDGSANNVHQDFLRNLMNQVTTVRYVVARNPNESNVGRYRQRIVENLVFHVLSREHLGDLPADLQASRFYTDP